VGRRQRKPRRHATDIELRFICSACAKRGADVRPDFNWNKKPVAMMDYH
jgi:hypothetical protein